MDTVVNNVFWLLILVAIVVYVRWSRRMKREHQAQLGVLSLTRPAINGLREDLLTYVDGKTYKQDQTVHLGGFWAMHQELTLGDKHHTIKPLLEERVLVVPDVINEGEFVPYNFNTPFGGVPEVVALSEKAWTRLNRHDESPRQVIIDTIYATDMSNHVTNNQTGGDGSVFASAQSGTGDATANANVVSNGLTAEHLAQLSAALRRDVEHLTDPVAAALVDDLADEVDAAKERPGSAEAGGLLRRVDRIVTKVGAGSGALGATLNVLEKLGILSK